jgi:hypothetical protein
MLNDFKPMKNNISVIRSILSESSSEDEIHRKLDVLLNTTKIFYKSLDDFNRNFPKSDDLDGKIKLIIARRK